MLFSESNDRNWGNLTGDELINVGEYGGPVVLSYVATDDSGFVGSSSDSYLPLPDCFRRA